MQPKLYEYSSVSDACMKKVSFSSQSPSFTVRSSDCCHQSPNSADSSKNYTKDNLLSLIQKNGEKNSHFYNKMLKTNKLEKISNKSKRIAKVKIFFG